MSKEKIEITGLQHHAEGNQSVVSIEVSGKWIEISRQDNSTSYSHIFEPQYLEKLAEN